MYQSSSRCQQGVPNFHAGIRQNSGGLCSAKARLPEGMSALVGVQFWVRGVITPTAAGQVHQAGASCLQQFQRCHLALKNKNIFQPLQPRGAHPIWGQVHNSAEAANDLKRPWLNNGDIMPSEIGHIRERQIPCDFAHWWNVMNKLD